MPLLSRHVQVTFKLCRKNVPRNMAELVVKYRLNAGDLLVQDLITERDFLARRLGIPEYLLQVLSWGEGSVVIMYWMVRDLLPLAELALCREDVRAELTQHGVEEVYLDSHPSKHPSPVSSRGMVPWLVQCGTFHNFSLLHCRKTNFCRAYIVRKPQHSLSRACTCVSLARKSCSVSMHANVNFLVCIPLSVVQRRTIVSVLDAHCHSLKMTALTSDLKNMGILSAEQFQKLASLDDKEKRHENLMYTLLAHNGPDIYHKLVQCMGASDISIAADLQGVLV